jgi:hypothetical protein
MESSLHPYLISKDIIFGMGKEFGAYIAKDVMDEFWSETKLKTYAKFQGVWEKRGLIPFTHTKGFDKRLEDDFEIPLLGGGYISLSKAEGKHPHIALLAKFPTSRGDDNMILESVIVTEKPSNEDMYPFTINYGDENSDKELMKYLARMDPEKDINWERISPEYIIAKAFNKYKKIEE